MVELVRAGRLSACGDAQAGDLEVSPLPFAFALRPLPLPLPFALVRHRGVNSSYAINQLHQRNRHCGMGLSRNPEVLPLSVCHRGMDPLMLSISPINETVIVAPYKSMNWLGERPVVHRRRGRLCFLPFAFVCHRGAPLA